MKSKANCESPAIYFYSCKCGEKGTETFTSGSLKQHTEGNITVENLVQSTCSTLGSQDVVTYCKVCSIEISRNTYEIDYKPHRVTDWISGENATSSEAGYQYRQCNDCDHEETVTSKICTTCGGDGLKEVSEDCPNCTDGYSYKTCDLCNGNGKFTTSEWKTCSFCGGTGWVIDGFGKTIKCLCGGSGGSYVKQDCGRCSGTGKITNGKCTKCSGSKNITKYVICDNCNNGEYREFVIRFDSNGGYDIPADQKSTGNSCIITRDVPTKSGYTFVGWNTITQGDLIYQPGDVYDEGNVTLYAMWLPTCPDCDGVGHFVSGSICQKCDGDRYYYEYVNRCNTCSSTNVTKVITGYFSYYYCNRCGGIGASTESIRYNCYQCTNGYINSTTDCETCDANGYILPDAPEVMFVSTNTVVLQKTEGYEYSIDGKNWQECNIFTSLYSATNYTFYQRVAKTNDTLFGPTSKPTTIQTN